MSSQHKNSLSDAALIDYLIMDYEEFIGLEPLTVTFWRSCL